jgi:predicted PurR-regulated permease PerM
MKKSSDLYRRYLVWGLSGPLIFLNFWVLGQLFSYFEQLITIVVTASILGLLLSYPVRALEKRRVGRLIAILAVLTLLIAGVILLGFTVIPLVLDQANQLLNFLPQWLEKTGQQLFWLQEFAQSHRVNIDVNKLADQLQQPVQRMVTTLPALAIGTIGRLIDAVFILVLALYMLLYGAQMWRGLIDLLPPRFGRAFSQSIQFNVQQFFISQFLLALIMMLALIPVFIVLRVNFALLFALIIGLFELVPFIGATAGIALVTMLTLLQGFWTAFWVAVIAIALQQVRDNVIAPRLLGRFIGLNPIWIFVSLLLGARIAGVLGVILAIPIAGTIKGTVEQLRLASFQDLARSPSADSAPSLES